MKPLFKKIVFIIKTVFVKVHSTLLSTHNDFPEKGILNWNQ